MRRDTRQPGPVALTLGLVLGLGALGGLAHAARAAGRPIFTLTDPRGDDHGDGSLVYPVNYYGLMPGDLDLLSLQATAVDGGTEFEATFAAQVKTPSRRTIDIGGGSLDDVARLGFYNLNLDIYIDTDHVPGSGGIKTLPGRKAEVEEKSAWEKAICLTPRPLEARSALKRILMKQLQRQLGGASGVSRDQVDSFKAVVPEDVDSHIFFPTRVRVLGQRIRFLVPDSFLGGPAQPSWGYVVAVTAADIDLRFEIDAPTLGKGSDERLMLLPIAPGGGSDHLGGGREGDDQQPPIVDLLVPPGLRQEDILRGDRDKHGLVRLPAVVPSQVPAQATPAKP